ncbi:hypothetical protein SELMODRAFT_402098 [Selaginella moellendorffii]|uniref:Uncharacterized protein n=1 Tax=Selaginella moellendorffii TaxID=88036 RepID=D8QPK6_SELML|nr:hypothetical protein SELMODRAFT_402098 [Selaginella moellendorffii]
MGLGPSIFVLSRGEEPSIPLQTRSSFWLGIADLLQVGSTYGGGDFLELAEILRMRSDDLPSHFIVKVLLGVVGHWNEALYGAMGMAEKVFSSGANLIVYHPNAALCNVVELVVSGVSHAPVYEKIDKRPKSSYSHEFSSCERQHTCTGDSDGYNAGVSLVKQAFEGLGADSKLYGLYVKSKNVDPFKLPRRQGLQNLFLKLIEVVFTIFDEIVIADLPRGGSRR